MSTIVTLQPGPSTAVLPVQHAGQPPCLMLHDGSATVAVVPAPIDDGLAVAAVFARQLVAAAIRWAEDCEEQLARAASGDPLAVDTVVADFNGAGPAGDTGPG